MLSPDLAKRLKGASPEVKLKAAELLEQAKQAQKIEDARSTIMGFVKHTWPAFIEGRHHKIMAEAFERIARGELTACGENQVFGIGELAMKQIERWQPERWQVRNGGFSDLGGGDLTENLKIMRSLLKGNAPDSLRNTVLVNASTALWIQGKCASLEEGIELADSLLINGNVEKWLEKVSDFFK